MTSLELGYNRIGAQGAERLAAALETNVTVMSFNLQGNQIGSSSLVAMQALVEKNGYGVRVATVHCSRNVGSDDVSISFTDLGGNKIASFELAPSAALTDLISSLSSQTTHRGHWRFALADAIFLGAIHSMTAQDLYASVYPQAASVAAKEEPAAEMVIPFAPKLYACLGCGEAFAKWSACEKHVLSTCPSVAKEKIDRSTLQEKCREKVLLGMQ